MKKIFVICILAILMVGIFSVFAKEQKGMSQEPDWDWIKRVSYNVEFETDKVPIFYFETIQPLYQNPDETTTYFIQPRVSIKGKDAIYNLGVGYRFLPSEEWLLGVNMFGDYQDDHEHGRIGFGGEALGKRIEARLNTYLGLTTARKVEEQDGINAIYEQVADGLDAELGSPMPYLPWLKIYGSGFWWNFKHSNDRFGWKSRLEATINKWSIMEFYVWDDNKGETELGGKLEVKIPFNKWADIGNAFKFSKVAYPDKDLRDYNLIPVERNFDIVVERWTETPNGTITVQVGRGS